jgi:alkanesulfonate monooxygenase SsuD/methylene tetrahydromethanopterin reductase-like flavin-dependent oxidoreductase (luciferase family)
LTKIIDFGWEIPTGSRRMVTTADHYDLHLHKMLKHVSGHFQSVWIPDHLMDADHRPYPEALTTLSYLSAIYSEFLFGTVVLGQSYRNPALLAKMSATLQHLSGNRFVLGIGAGWKEDEYLAYGYNFPSPAVRIAQLAEVVQICKTMWDPAQPVASFQGAHYRIDNAFCDPKPTLPPPIMIGGAGEKLTLRVVAKHADWWNLVGVSPETYTHKLSVLEAHCAEVSRNPTDIRKTWMGVVSISRDRMAANAAMANYPIWSGDVPIVGTPGEVTAQLHSYTKLGIDLFILGFVDEPHVDGIDMFINKVIPEFRS